MYRAETYTVCYTDTNGNYHRAACDIETEAEARQIANNVWKRSDSVEVEISKATYYKKRRHSVTIAIAHK